MNALGSYLISREQLDRNERQADAEWQATLRRPDAPSVAEDGPADASRGIRWSWLGRILAAREGSPVVARRRGAHI
jgi:hypothetical protein